MAYLQGMGLADRGQLDPGGVVALGEEGVAVVDAHLPGRQGVDVSAMSET